VHLTAQRSQEIVRARALRRARREGRRAARSAPRCTFKPQELTVDLVQASYDARRKLAPILNPSRTDPRAARGAGKKIIQYHGWADPLISAELSLTYFNAVQKALGDTQNFYLLFMVPGMGHCGGGVGPTWIMGAGVIHDAQHDAVNALTRWVEEGTAPDRIIATEFVMPALDPNVGPPLDPMVGPPAGTPVKSIRPLCHYPKVAVYKGRGNTADAVNFECKRPPATHL
jgi:feruloyl esterase